MNESNVSSASDASRYLCGMELCNAIASEIMHLSGNESPNEILIKYASATKDHLESAADITLSLIYTLIDQSKSISSDERKTLFSVLNIAANNLDSSTDD